MSLTSIIPGEPSTLGLRTLRFILLVGPPGCGKSTYVELLFLQSLVDVAKLSPDSLRFELTGDVGNHSKDGFIWSKLIFIRMNGYHAQGMDIIFDATSYSRRNRKDVIKHAKWLGYRVEAHVFRVPIEVCKARNAARERVVDEAVIDKMVAGWQEPELSEGLDAIVEVPYVTIS